MTREGAAKLTDLGLAIDLADQAAVTREGATVGTFDYVSPEQARHSHSVDTRSDIYSLGCSIYHMLTGQVPYPSPSLPEKLFGHQALDPEPIRTLVPEVPEGLVEVVRKMMRKKPDDRYATPLEVAQALEPFTGESPSASGGYDLTASAAGPGASRPTQTATRVAAAPRTPEPAVTEMFAPVRDGTPAAASPSGSGSDFGLLLDLGPRAPRRRPPSRRRGPTSTSRRWPRTSPGPRRTCRGWAWGSTWGPRRPPPGSSRASGPIGPPGWPRPGSRGLMKAVAGSARAVAGSGSGPRRCC